MEFCQCQSNYTHTRSARKISSRNSLHNKSIDICYADAAATTVTVADGKVWSRSFLEKSQSEKSWTYGNLSEFEIASFQLKLFRKVSQRLEIAYLRWVNEIKKTRILIGWMQISIFLPWNRLRSQTDDKQNDVSDRLHYYLSLKSPPQSSAEHSCIFPCPPRPRLKYEKWQDYQMEKQQPIFCYFSDVYLLPTLSESQ